MTVFVDDAYLTHIVSCLIHLSKVYIMVQVKQFLTSDKLINLGNLRSPDQGNLNVCWCLIGIILMLWCLVITKDGHPEITQSKWEYIEANHTH